MEIQRVILIVLDSLGVGEMPDAADFGDVGAHTLKHTAEAIGGLQLPALAKMGAGCLEDILGLSTQASSHAFYGKMAEVSLAKDTTTGHWEIAGVVSKEPARLYPQGFPSALIEAFETAIGRKTLGNIAASGTEIIEQLGEAHLKTGYPIVYTSADSVFQIACHEEKIPINQLYRFCEIARTLCDAYQVGRVIARPFRGQPGSFVRTLHRRDFAMLPPEKTLLEKLVEKNVPVIGIGKIGDIFSERGLSQSYHTQSNAEGIEQTFRCLAEQKRGLIFVNLVDFDMLYGHRRDPQGYAQALQAFDLALASILEDLNESDILMITADHGCDPTYLKSTDHTREYVPIWVYAPGSNHGGSLGTRQSFADVAATIAEIFGLSLDCGKSFFGMMS